MGNIVIRYLVYQPPVGGNKKRATGREHYLDIKLTTLNPIQLFPVFPVPF